jgi:hypothetical protein
MEVFKRTISNVFAGERRYVIPLFQRPYVWTRENQWEPLWEDIVERAEAELSKQQTDTPPHFLGAIVIQQRKSFGDELLAHDVIDGQQRLTTFQLFLAAFGDVARALDEKPIATWVESLSRNPNAISDPSVEQFKVWPTSRDVEQYRFVCLAGSKDAVEARHPPELKRKRLVPRPRMVEAYLFFHEAITAWLTEDSAASAIERARALRRVLDRRLQLVSIELEGQEDPQAIFETLNARGVPLLASDLLRNYIFQRAGGPDEAERLHGKYWARFEIPNDPAVPDGARFWEVEERQGRLNRARLDLFVQHYLAMKRGTDISSGRLFPEYKSWIESQHPFETLEKELSDFSGFADRFQKLVRPGSSTALGRFAARLRVLDTSTVYPLALGLLGNTRLSESERDKILADLESFLVRRLVCGRPTKNYNRLFIQLLRDFESTSGAPTSLKFRALLAASTGETVDWPDDAAFEKSWSTVDAYNGLKAARVEMILRAIDEAISSGKSESVTIQGKLTVEHVLPQDWNEHWPLPATADAAAATEQRDALVNDFGNLTLLTQALNSSVRNGPATTKLPAIALQSKLTLNTYFQGRTSWSESDVGERRQALFQTAKKIWPAPQR